jgi:hypothetical protein
MWQRIQDENVPPPKFRRGDFAGVDRVTDPIRDPAGEVLRAPGDKYISSTCTGSTTCMLIGDQATQVYKSLLLLSLTLKTRRVTINKVVNQMNNE